jgi:hypothetical protein
LFVHACMFCLPLYLMPGYLLRFSTFPNILTGVGCIYSFFVFATTPLYHGHFQSRSQSNACARARVALALVKLNFSCAVIGLTFINRTCRH